MPQCKRVGHHLQMAPHRRRCQDEVLLKSAENPAPRQGILSFCKVQVCPRYYECIDISIRILLPTRDGNLTLPDLPKNGIFFSGFTLLKISGEC